MKPKFKSENKIYEIDPKRVVTFVYKLQNILDKEIKKRSQNSKIPSGFLFFEDSKIVTLASAKYLRDFYKKLQDGPIIRYSIIRWLKETYDLNEYTKPKHFFDKTICILTDEFEKETGDFLKPFTLGEIVMSEDGSKLTLTTNNSDKLAINPKEIYDVAEKYLA